jgi:hypothetical protein
MPPTNSAPRRRRCHRLQMRYGGMPTVFAGACRLYGLGWVSLIRSQGRAPQPRRSRSPWWLVPGVNLSCRAQHRPEYGSGARRRCGTRWAPTLHLGTASTRRSDGPGARRRGASRLRPQRPWVAACRASSSTDGSSGPTARIAPIVSPEAPAPEPTVIGSGTASPAPPTAPPATPSPCLDGLYGGAMSREDSRAPGRAGR